jgi:hypothetical protein
MASAGFAAQQPLPPVLGAFLIMEAAGSAAQR